MGKKANLLSLQIQSLRWGDSGFDQAATFHQSDLASRGLELATGDKRLKTNQFKKVENKGYGKKGTASLSKMM